MPIAHTHSARMYRGLTRAQDRRKLITMLGFTKDLLMTTEYREQALALLDMLNVYLNEHFAQWDHPEEMLEHNQLARWIAHAIYIEGIPPNQETKKIPVEERKRHRPIPQASDFLQMLFARNLVQQTNPTTTDWNLPDVSVPNMDEAVRERILKEEIPVLFTLISMKRPYAAQIQLNHIQKLQTDNMKTFESQQNAPSAQQRET